MRYGVLWFAAACTVTVAGAQTLKPDVVKELRKDLPQLDQPEDARKGGYARDPNIRRQAARPDLEEQYSGALRRLEKADLDLYFAQRAVDEARVSANAVDGLTQQTEAKQRLSAAQEGLLPVQEEYSEASNSEEQVRQLRDKDLKDKKEYTCSAQGMAVQKNTIVVRFRDYASSVEIRQVLKRYDLTVRSWMPEIAFFVAELRAIQNESDAQQTVRLRRTIGFLRDEHAVFSAVQQGTIGSTIVPPPSIQAMKEPCWSWFSDCPGMIGLTLPRFPAAWNFNDAIYLRGTIPVSVAVLDAGFVDHEDLSFTKVCTDSQAAHGNLVAGIVAASWSNGVGIDGATPFASITACAPQPVIAGCPGDNALAFTDVMLSLQKLIVVTNARVINVSLGYNWVVGFGQSVNPAKRPDIKLFVESQGAAVRDLLRHLKDKNVVIVSAAGNDCGFDTGCRDSAEWTSPLNWAALGKTTIGPITGGSKNIFVVECADADGRISTLSNKGGTLAAPGIGLLGPADPGKYEPGAGTSLATPVASGLIALMLAYNPELTTDQIRSILRADHADNEPPSVVDSFDAMLQSRDDALRDLADLNHDGKVDMEDFKIFRSHLKQTEANVFTCDLNRDGRIDGNDACFPRSDLNGDGILSRTAKHAVWGFKDPVTDLEVMKRFWSDPKVKWEELQGMLDQ